MSDLDAFANDVLQRQDFANRVSSLVLQLASSDQVPGGRVLAIDAPWGSGKTWVAEKLPLHIKNSRCIYLNVFQFDYHSDPFAVLASAILEGCKDLGQQTRALRKSALNILRAAAPAITKEAVRAGAKLVGFDTEAAVEAISKAVETASDKSLEKILDSVEETSKSVEAFQKKLSELASASGGPLVLVIDELDRCRPDFSLALLERIKHLFEVSGVVFVLFVESRALKSAIRHTYGDIDADAYLRKFVSLWMELPTCASSEGSLIERSYFLRKFLDAQYPNFTSGEEQHEFIRSLAGFAPYFNATLRDVQNVMLLGSVTKQAVDSFGPAAALLLLVKVCDQAIFQQFRREPKEAARRIFDRLRGKVEDERQTSGVLRLHDVLLYIADTAEYHSLVQRNPQPRFVASEHECSELWKYVLKTYNKLHVEHLRLG